MKNYIVTAYYTIDTFYEKHARTFTASLEKFSIPYHLERVANLGSWLRNTGYKPTFLKQMMLKYPGKNIVYVDVDAEFLRYPELFENFEGDVGVYVFDRSCYRNPGDKLTEVLSGTIFLRNIEKVRNIVDDWIIIQARSPSEWDQRTLEAVLNGDFTVLPGEYCKIFDRQDEITDPVIVHYQASRAIRSKRQSVAK